MRNLPFVLWMVGWPLSVTLGRYLVQVHLSDALNGMVAALNVVIWIAIAALVYERQPKDRSAQP